jgi:hypothetical protein
MQVKLDREWEQHEAQERAKQDQAWQVPPAPAKPINPVLGLTAAIEALSDETVTAQREHQVDRSRLSWMEAALKALTLPVEALEQDLKGKRK